MMFNDGRVLSNFILQALLGEEITVYGDGTQTSCSATGASATWSCTTLICGPTAAIADGSYLWNAWCNDSAGNSAFNSTNFTITIDTAIPAIAFRSPTDINNTVIDSKNNRTWTFINASFAEINNASFIISFNGTNYTDITGGIGFFYKNITIPSDGTFTYYAWINDSAGNSNVTETRTIRFTSINITETLQPSLANINENVSVFGHINLTNGTNITNEEIGIYLNGTKLTLDDMTSITGNYSFSTGYHAVITHIGPGGDKATGGGYTARVTANTIVGNATNGSYSALIGYIRTLTKTINDTITDSRGNYNYTFTGPGYGGSFPVKINLTYGIFIGSSTATLTVETAPPTINWVNSTGFPSNITTASSITFYVNATDDNPANCTIYTNASGGWAANATNSYTSNAMSSFAAQSFPANAVYKWSVWCNDTVANLVQHNKNYTLTIDNVNPTWAGIGNNASIVSKNNTMVNWDSYGVMAHNYYLYNDPVRHLTWIPWDHNEALSGSPGITGTSGGDGAPGARRGLSLTMPLKRELLALADERGWVAGAFARAGIAPETLVVGIEPAAAEVAEAAERAAAADAVVLFLFDAHLHASNRALLDAVQARAHALAVVLLRDPWDAALLRPGVLGLTAYGFRTCQLDAVVARLVY